MGPLKRNCTSLMERPALFSGPENSDIAQWCKEYGIGFTLTENTAEDLKKFAENESGLTDLQQTCYQVYTEHFSKKSVVDGWKKLLNQSFEGEYI